MPLYEYECQFLPCQKTFEAFRKVEDRDIAACPGCGVNALRKFTPTALVFVHEHFRHLQSAFLPDKEDKVGWENRGNCSFSHAPKPEGPTLKEHLERDLIGLR